MANKEFKIQSDTVSLNGVPLSSSTDGKVVIPGVTRSTGFRVEEVEDSGDQTYQFTPNSEVVVIDLVLYNAIIEGGNESLYADYTATTDDEGYIDEIQVNGRGTYIGGESYANETNDMKAYIGEGSASDRPLVEQDWISIPFRPKMKATGVESEFSGGGNTGDILFDGSLIESDTSATYIHMDGEGGEGILAIGTNDGKAVKISTAGGANSFVFSSNSGLTFPDGSTQTKADTGGGSSLAPQLTKVEDEIVLTGTLHLGQAAGGSISELDSEGNINFWFNSATGDLAGRKYAVGSDNNGTAFLICFGTDGSAVWTYTFDQIDFGGSIGQQTVYPFVVKHWTDTNDNNSEYIYVGFDSSSYIGVAKFAIDGTKVSHWVYTHSEDPNQASFDQHDMAI